MDDDRKPGRPPNQLDDARAEVDAWLKGQGGTVVAVMIAALAVWTVIYVVAGLLR